MLTYFKVNSEQALEWNEDLNDLTFFIVIIATVEHEFGLSTCIVANRKHQKDVTSRFSVLGCSTIKAVSQFDTKTKTGIACPNEGMPLVGLNALREFIEAKRATPFRRAALK